MIDFGKFQQSRIAHNTFMPQHVRPSKAGGMPPMFESRPQVTTYTEINIDNTPYPNDTPNDKEKYLTVFRDCQAKC